jgi:hypothetical protein
MYLATLVSLAAALITHAAGPACDRMRGSSTDVDGDGTTIVVSDDARGLAVRANGRIEFTEDDADVRALGPGTTLRIVERRGGTTRSMVLVERAGRIEREYRVDDLRLPATEGAGWLRGIVLDLVRTTGFGAEERVARIRRQRGVSGVLDEVGQLRSDHVRRIYLAALVAGGGLSDSELGRVARTASTQIGSDHDKAETLLAVTEAQAPGRDGAAVIATAVASAGQTIGSDHDRGRVLTALVGRARLDDAAPRAAFFRAVDGIGSDHEKAAVLIAASAHADWLRTPAARAAFDAAVRSIGSDAEYRRVMRAFER